MKPQPLTLTPEEYGRQLTAVRSRLEAFRGVAHKDIVSKLLLDMANRFARTSGLDPLTPFRCWPVDQLCKSQRIKWQYLVSLTWRPL